ncbi:MAG: cytochrome b N-terminal domain-containing protein [Desulfobacterales bacterium]|nr:cytochrome b N-terminal domain-containing protein [Desulfobacterales bacterium]
MRKADLEETPEGAIKRSLVNLARLPRHLKSSVMRHGAKDAGRLKSQLILSSIFLHIHSIKTHRFSLRWNYTFGLGIMCIGLFAILSLSGFLLMIYYKPDTAQAYSSIKDLIYVIPSGRLVRNIHRWAAHLMVIASFLHMARVFYTGAYKRGREFNWNIGLALFVLTLGLSFTGYLLPWDQLAYWATTIGVNIAASPTELTDALNITGFFDIGTKLKHLLLGADQIANDALIRFYFLHCILLPFFMTLFVAIHIWRIRKNGGLSRPDCIDEEWLKGTPENNKVNNATKSGLFQHTDDSVKTKRSDAENLVHSIPHAFLKEFVAVVFILAITVALSSLFDAPLKEPANLFIPENPAKAPWYLVGIQELVSYSAFMGGIGIPIIGLFVLALIPYIDRDKGAIGIWFENKTGIRVTKLSACYALICCVTMLAFTIVFGWLRAWFPDIPQFLIILINPGTILVLMFAAWSLFVLQRYDSIRMGAMALFTCFFIAVIILTYFASVHRGPNWDFYWWPSLWANH